MRGNKSANNERKQGVMRVHKRLSFDSPVVDREQAKRFQFDTSSEEEEVEEAALIKSKLQRLCLDLKDLSHC